MSDEEDDIDWQARAEQAERQLAEAVGNAQQRLIRAELKTEALRAGMVDLDGIKLLDAGELVLDEKGELPAASRIMAAFKRDKPWLFGGASSSSGAKPPAAQTPTQKLATDMSHDEWRQARAEILRRK